MCFISIESFFKLANLEVKNMIFLRCKYSAALLILLFALSTCSSDQTLIDDRLSSISDLKHSKIKCMLAARDTSTSVRDESDVFDQCQPFKRLVKLWTEIADLLDTYFVDMMSLSRAHYILYINNVLSHKMNELFSSIYGIRSKKIARQTQSIFRSRAIIEIGFVGPYPEANSQHFDKLYSQSTELTSVSTARPETQKNVHPILKIPTLQNSFFSVYPQYEYLMQYSNHTVFSISRHMYQKVLTILRLGLEYYALEVAAKILDTQKNVRKVVVLNWETIWDENMRTFPVDTSKSGPCDLVNFYEDLEHGDAFDQATLFSNYIKLHVLKTWYNKIVYFQFETEIDCKNNVQTEAESESDIGSKSDTQNWITCQPDAIRQCLCEDADLEIVFLKLDSDLEAKLQTFEDEDVLTNVDDLSKNSITEHKYTQETEIDPMQLKTLIEDITQLVIPFGQMPERSWKSKETSSAKVVTIDETHTKYTSNLQLDQSESMNAGSFHFGIPVLNRRDSKSYTFLNFKNKQQTDVESFNQQEKQQDDVTKTSSFIPSISRRISPQKTSSETKLKSGLRLASLSTQGSLDVDNRMKSTIKTADKQSLRDIGILARKTSTSGTNERMHANSKHPHKSAPQSNIDGERVRKPSVSDTRRQSKMRSHVGKVAELKLNGKINQWLQI